MASPTDDPHQPMDDRLVNRRLFVQRRAGQLGGDHRTSAGEISRSELCRTPPCLQPEHESVAYMSRAIQQGMEQTIRLGSPGCGPMATMPKVDQYVVINRFIGSMKRTMVI